MLPPPLLMPLRSRTLLCMLRALPPMNVSSTSTSPESRKLSVCMASRMRWRTNHADFWVIPSDRPSSWELIPFLELATSHTAGSHLSRPSGESSKIVPSFTLYCFSHALHFHSRLVVR